MAHSIGAVIVAASLLLGQTQNFGTDPEEKTRGERMIAQNEKMLSQNRLAIGIAILALVVSMASLVLVFVFQPR
jgi:hypothetical protein